MNWLLNRLKEKSTWLGIFTLFGLLGMKLNPELQELITQAILAVAAIVAFVFRENIRERSTDQLPQTPELPPIDFIGRPERYVPPATGPLDSQYQPPMPGDHPDRNRRATDQWVCSEPVPSQTGFKHPTVRNEGVVGWNESS